MTGYTEAIHLVGQAHPGKLAHYRHLGMLGMRPSLKLVTLNRKL